MSGRRAARAACRLALWLGVAVVTAISLVAMGLLYLFLSGAGAALDWLTARLERARRAAPPAARLDKMQNQSI